MSASYTADGTAIYAVSNEATLSFYDPTTFEFLSQELNITSQSSLKKIRVSDDGKLMAIANGEAVFTVKFT